MKYKVEILDKPFFGRFLSYRDNNDVVVSAPQTAKITFFKDVMCDDDPIDDGISSEEVATEKRNITHGYYYGDIGRKNISIIYGYKSPEIIQEAIDAEVAIDLNCCYINMVHFQCTKIGEFHAERSFFDGACDFTNSFFSGNVDFSGAFFSGETHFDKAKFCKDVTFYSAKFFDSVFFSKSECLADANFKHVKFTNNLYFSKTKFIGNVNFIFANFIGLAYFNEVIFGNDACFDEIIYSDDIIFSEATFNGDASFSRDIPSNEIYNYGIPQKTDSEEYGDVAFNKATFKGKAVFSGLKVATVEFVGARFFLNVSIYFARCNKMDFNYCTFEKSCTIEYEKELVSISFMKCVCGAQLSVPYSTNLKNAIMYSIQTKKEELRQERSENCPVSILRVIRQILFILCFPLRCLRNIKYFGLSSLIHDIFFVFLYVNYGIKSTIYGIRDIIIGKSQMAEDYIEKAKEFNLLKTNYRKNEEFDYEDQAFVEYRRCMRKSRNRFFRFFDWVFLDGISCYCTKPFRVFWVAIITILAFAGFFYLSIILPNVQDAITFGENYQGVRGCLYHSLITFFTIGYGDSQPLGDLGLFLTGLEGFIGVFLMSLFTVSFVRKVLR